MNVRNSEKVHEHYSTLKSTYATDYTAQYLLGVYLKAYEHILSLFQTEIRYTILKAYELPVGYKNQEYACTNAQDFTASADRAYNSRVERSKIRDTAF